MDVYAPPPVWSFFPFIALLLAIAIFPLVHKLAHAWEKNSNKLAVSLLLAMLTLVYYGTMHNGVKSSQGPEGAHAEHGGLLKGLPAVLHVLQHSVLDEFVPFIVLLFSLYTISGGILIKGDIQATPRTNTLFLALGGLLASFIGTTGASMLLIRPVLRTNAERKHKVHTIVFFIFVVSNIGGSLTPLGDPPLFLGYLMGVPFWWTLHLFGPMLFLTASLLVIYFIWDTVAYRSEEARDIAEDVQQVRPLAIQGGINFLWLLGVIGCVAVIDPSRPLPGLGIHPPPYLREGMLLFLSALSWFTTPLNREIRAGNSFNFGAILEVACLFIGIFICMSAPVEYLRSEGPKLGLKTSQAFFWASGSLSSVLDNAPTYVVFFETAKALTASLGQQAVDVVKVKDGLILTQLLLALSMGSVFMGANTYIGNGPNFMVKTIAEQSGVKMPSFFGYMVYSIVILIPLFFTAMLIFLC